MLSIDSIMTTDVVTIAPSDSLALARDLMHEKKIHHLPVVDGEQNYWAKTY